MLPLYQFISVIAIIILTYIVVVSIRHLGDED